MKELLDRLKIADPETWRTWNLMHAHMTPGSVMSDAWLQAVIQDAIGINIDPTVEKRAHTWGYTIERDRDGIVAWVHADEIEHSGEGKSPAAALLAAYLAAIEARSVEYK